MMDRQCTPGVKCSPDLWSPASCAGIQNLLDAGRALQDLRKTDGRSGGPNTGRDQDDGRAHQRAVCPAATSTQVSPGWKHDARITAMR